MFTAEKVNETSGKGIKKMDAGATKVMEGPRQFLQESPSQSDGNSVSAFGKSCNNFPLDNARTVALETTQNPLSYWPPPSSSLPLMNSSKDMMDNFQNQPCSLDHSYPMDSLKHLNSNIHGEERTINNDNDESHPLNDDLSSISANQSTKNLHHHLPPIAGITSSHNYRGAKETHKHSQINTVEVISKSVAEKISTEESSVECLENNKNNNSTNSGNSKISSNSGKNGNSSNNNDCKAESKEPVETKSGSEVLNGEKVNHSEIQEVKHTPPEEDSTHTKSDYIFSVPTALNSSTSHSKALLSPRAPTPFIHSSAPSPSSSSSFSEALTLNSNITSTLSAGSPSPSNRTVPSPHFVSPSPKSSHMQCGSPSESPRILPSPHSNLSSPSNLHRAPPPSPHSVLFSQNNSPSHRMGSLPYVQNSHSNLAYLSNSKTNFNNSLAQNFHSDSSNSNSIHDTVETVRMLKGSIPQNPINHNVQIDLSNSNISLRNQSHSNPPQRIDQSMDSQSCRNPFELPTSKHCSQHYPSAQASQLQQQQFSFYSNNFRHLQDLHSKPGHFVNLPSTVKEHCRPKGNSFCPSGISSITPGITSENERENNGDAHNKQIYNSQTTISKGLYAPEPPQNDGSSTNSLGSEIPQPDYSNQLELSNNKSGSGGNGEWNKSETNGFESKNMYLSSQNVAKNFHNSNANDYSNWRISETVCQNSGKREMNALEGFSERFEKQSGSFSSLSQKFPPVPQSNYDLNRQIYDSMTGGNRLTQSSGAKPSEKNSLLFPTSRNRIAANLDISKSQPQYRNFSEQDKRKNYIQTTSTPRVPILPGQEYRMNTCGQFSTLTENTINEGFPNKRPTGSQTPMSSAFSSHVQSIEMRSSQVVPTHDHHRALGQGFPSEMNSAYHISQTASPKAASEIGCRSTHSSLNHTIFLQKHQQSLVDFESKKTVENKLRGNTVQYSPPQNLHSGGQPMVPSTQTKSRTSSFANTQVRSKRESPLDLSVKTVRQSADSTAKDDGDVCVQSFRNNLHGSSQSVHSENRYAITQSSEGVTVAPKIDFTPNFSGFHTESQIVSAPGIHKNTESSVLPPLESFKKMSVRLSAPILSDGKTKSSFSSGKYLSSPAISNQKPKGLSPDTMTNTHLHSHMDNYIGEIQKRPSNDPVRTHSSQTKIPKIDPWKLAFDEQIEQRLNSARLSQENCKQERVTNGIDTHKAMDIAAQNSKYQTLRHSSNHYRSANMYPQPPVQTSAAPYNPGYVHQPQCQPAAPQTPQEKIHFRENVGHSPDPEQIIKQISKGVMPDHKLLQDKNVLSILRSSLEEKEAKLMQLREAARKKERCKEFVNSDLCKKSFETFEQSSKNLMHDKRSLPPFGALTLERMCAPPSFPGHRLNLSRSADTVRIDIEPTQKYYSSTVKNNSGKSGIPNVNMSPQDDAQGPPTDFDGLAAFLAARIRTKGELKQVDSGLSQPGSGTSVGEYLDKGHPTSHSFPSNFPLSGSPPKLVRESRLLPPIRRKLTSHAEDDTPSTSDVQCDDQLSLPLRDPNGIRSSSETSVFDFRESDSEGEMPVLERQTLEGMRRDRKTFGSKQNLSITTLDEVMEVDKPEVIAELDKSHPDPFWNTAFDMFVEQLEKRPPKRSVRKKKVCSRTPFVDAEADEGDDSSKEKILLKTAIEDNGKSNDEEAEGCSKVEERKEREERDKVEVQEGHIKLSSSRLKVYRNELMRENKLTESKIERMGEKLVENVEKPSKDAVKEVYRQKTKEPPNQGKKVEKEQKAKKGRSGIRTRAKSRTSATKSTALGDDSDTDEREARSDTESEDDDDSLFLSGSESDSSSSETNRDSSNSNFTSCDDSEVETVTKKRMRIQTRLQTRSSKQRQVKGTGMKLRSKLVPQPKTSTKPVKKKKKKKKEEYYSCGKKKKPSFGDGSDFRPGWEEECYKFKQQLRMPEKLISISRPPKRSSVSLPDLEPYRNSPSFDSSDLPAVKKTGVGKVQPESDESDVDGGKSKSKTQETSGSLVGSDGNMTSLLKLRNGKKSRPTSILNLLVDKYAKGNTKKQKDGNVRAMNDKKSPKILPKGSNKPELLPTPSLGVGKENVLKDKKRGKDVGKKKVEESDSVYIGYFRRRTVNNFKEAFKQKVGLLPQDFNPVILKSRTRTQTRDLKKRATLVEVFGDERPASAPPLSREEDVSTDQEKTEKPAEKRKPKIPKKVSGGVVTRGRGKLIRSGRPGLRSTAVLRSNRAVQISKRHLNSGRKRNMELLRMRAMACKKFSYLVNSSEPANQLPITKKRLKLRSVRRKFRSGFDYIRKKKKLKKDGDSADGSVKEKRLPARPTSESVEDIQNEIKNWVINKGLGETILHRAARLGYTDVAAYCLEKMDCSPSPRDNAGYTPLHEACSRGHLEIAKLLLMYGASVSESAKGGVRPLHEAAENGFTELIRLLLSYGADPLLETYTGHTALSLVTDEEAKRLILHHLADVQGNVAPVWSFQGPSSLFDPLESGYDPLCDPPSPVSVSSDCELEVSETMLPPLYRFVSDREPERRWLLIRDLLSHTKVKSKDLLIKQLGAPSVREMKLSDFYEQGKCCNLLGMGEKLLTKPSKIALVPYSDKVRQLLGVEKIVI